MNEADKTLVTRLAGALGDAYTIEGEIGRGGMGVVYRARDERLKRRVAIKLLPPDLGFRDDIRARFLREAETAARLLHPNIVPIYSVGESPDGLVYFVMGYVDGESVGDRLKRRGRLPAEEVRRILRETADALGAAHTIGIVHRDVKPDNVLLEGTRGRVMVTDFGIAKALQSGGPGTLTATGVAIGTPHFMSPEQAAGDKEIDGRSDIYSLGIVGYLMLTGELPFQAPTVPGILMKHIMEDAPMVRDKRSDCPEDLEAIVMRSLEKEPEARWATADALRRALESGTTPAFRPGARASQGRQLASRRQSPAFPGRGAPLPEIQIPRSPDVLRGRRPSRGRRPDQVPKKKDTNIVEKARHQFASWASICGGLVMVDVVTGGAAPDWSIMVAGFWAAFGVLPTFVKLWQAGYSWRDVFNRPPAPDAVAARKSGIVLPAATTDEFGTQRSSVEQARRDREVILKIVEKLPSSERQMLPDVKATVEALLKRSEDLARTLHSMSADVDDGAMRRLDAKIDATKQHAQGAERDRQLTLLERQRQALSDLLSRRRKVEEQLESCGIAMQNVRFDLLRLRSAGIEAVLGDLTAATQQAKALSRDVDAVIAAAAEVNQAIERPRL
jgi:serine/threonine protein kinase